MNNENKSLSESQEDIMFYLAEAKNDLLTFCQLVDPKFEVVWFHEVIASALTRALEAVRNKKKARIILTVPPRTGKTQLASIYFPAWALGKYPDLRFILSTYGSDLSEKVGQKARDVIGSEKYQAMFPGTTLRQDTKAKARWMTKKGGEFNAVGVGSAVTGTGADCILLDDVHKDRAEAESELMRERAWEYYRSTLYSRLEGFGAVIVIMQRWHCFSKNQLVDIAGKLTPISDVREGDLILTPKGYQPVQHIIKNKTDKKTLRLHFAGSVIPLEVTEDHRIKTLNGWVEAGKLNVGDNALLEMLEAENTVPKYTAYKKDEGKIYTTYTGKNDKGLLAHVEALVKEGLTGTEIAERIGRSRAMVVAYVRKLGLSTAVKNTLKGEFWLDKDFWWILGRWAADGSISRGAEGRAKSRISIVVGKNKKSDIDIISAFLNKHKVKFSVTETFNRETGEVSSYNVRFSCQQLAEYIADIGHGAKNKRVPTWVFGSGFEEDFIAGYYSGDGSTREGKTRASSISNSLINGLHHLLLLRNRHSNMFMGPSERDVEINGKVSHCQQVYELHEVDCDKTKDGGRTKRLQKIEVLDYTDEVYDVTVPCGEVNVGGVTVHNCDDVVGRLLEDSKNKKEAGEAYDEWEVINFPAIAIEDEKYRKAGEALWPSKFPVPVLENIRSTLGNYNFASQYQQDPILAESQEFQETMFKYYEPKDIEKIYLRYYTIVDPAISQKQEADNTVVLTVAKEVYGPYIYRIREDAGHYTPKQTQDLVFKHQAEYKSEVFVETVAYQKALKYNIEEEQRRRNSYFTINEVKSATNKEIKIRGGLLPMYENGVIFHKRTDRDYEHELLSFPRGKRDDRIDAMAMIVTEALQNTRTGRAAKQFRQNLRGYFRRND